MKSKHRKTCFAVPIILCSSCFFTLPASAQLSAAFSASVVKGCSPLTVQFRDQSTGNVGSWFWDFGNHITSSERNPTVVYEESGNFTVRLIVRNGNSADYEEKQNY